MPTSSAFRDVLARFATGVTVMTTVVDGEPHGMTANAVASVSLEPLLVLVCVERSAEMADRVAEAGVFALSVLAADQQHLSERFADPARSIGTAMFADVATREVATGAPVLEGTIGWLDCRVWASYDGGDHVIVVGEVVDLGVGAGTDALLYFTHDYHQLHVDGQGGPA